MIDEVKSTEGKGAQPRTRRQGLAMAVLIGKERIPWEQLRVRWSASPWLIDEPSVEEQPNGDDQQYCGGPPPGARNGSARPSLPEFFFDEAVVLEIVRVIRERNSIAVAVVPPPGFFACTAFRARF